EDVEGAGIGGVRPRGAEELDQRAREHRHQHEEGEEDEGAEGELVLAEAAPEELPRRAGLDPERVDAGELRRGADRCRLLAELGCLHAQPASVALNGRVELISRAVPSASAEPSAPRPEGTSYAPGFPQSQASGPCESAFLPVSYLRLRGPNRVPPHARRDVPGARRGPGGRGA